MDSPSSPLQEQSNIPLRDGVHRRTSASHIKHPFPSPRTSGMLAHAPSSSHLKARRSSPSSSLSPPSPSSSSSSDSLAPPVFDFKRSQRHHRQRPCSPALFPLPRGPCPFGEGERVGDPRGFATQIAPSTSEALKSYPHQMRSLGGSTDPAPPFTGQDGNSISSTQPRDTGGMHCEDIRRHCDDDPKDNRKLLDTKDNRKVLMWRAACAMAHAYLHQHDLHSHELHLHGLDQHQQLHMGDIDSEGHHLREDICNVRSSRSIESAPSLPAPAPAPAKVSSRGEMYPSSMCPSNDVVCIDEVVNPTQAAEWFGTLFLTTSALVS